MYYTAREIERFWKFVPAGRGHECWPWMGARVKGYGVFGITRGNTTAGRAHRIAWELAHNERLGDWTVDHLCRNRCCVNPRHLERVSRSENSSRGNQYERCKAGVHSWTPENTMTRPGKPGRRECRACALEGARRRKRMRVNG